MANIVDKITKEMKKYQLMSVVLSDLNSQGFVNSFTELVSEMFNERRNGSIKEFKEDLKIIASTLSKFYSS